MTLTHERSRAPKALDDRAERAVQEARRRAQFQAMGEHNADRDAAAFHAKLTEQEAAYDAWRIGGTHPDDDLFALIWAGQSKGVSEDGARARVASDTATIDAIEKGKLDHTGIPGWRALGPDQATVLENLRKRVDLYEEALRCGGRNLSINQVRVARIKRGQA